ncbi:MAG: 50S ribosomal protein L29 [Desulfobacterales bacterium]|jgi:large subunit ribosomal protein L29
MKAGEFRSLSSEERRQKLVELKQELFNLRFQHATGQLENPQRLKQIKRDVARVQTIMREEELSIHQTEAR